MTKVITTDLKTDPIVAKEDAHGGVGGSRLPLAGFHRSTRGLSSFHSRAFIVPHVGLSLVGSRWKIGSQNRSSDVSGIDTSKVKITASPSAMSHANSFKSSGQPAATTRALIHPKFVQFPLDLRIACLKTRQGGFRQAKALRMKNNPLPIRIEVACSNPDVLCMTFE